MNGVVGILPAGAGATLFGAVPWAFEAAAGLTDVTALCGIENRADCP
jgi:hypothetical protein